MRHVQAWRVIEVLLPTPRKVPAMRKLDYFTRAYIRTMLWSSTDESTECGGDPLDRNYTESDIAPEALERIVLDCAAFQATPECLAASDLDSYDSERAGHDFWLTRNGHGAGFWDGDWPAPHGDTLTTASKRFGELNPYIGDDGRIYL